MNIITLLTYEKVKMKDTEKIDIDYLCIAYSEANNDKDREKAINDWKVLDAEEWD